MHLPRTVPEVAVPGLQFSNVRLECFWLQYPGNMYVVAQIDYMEEAAKVLACAKKLLGHLQYSHALRLCLACRVLTTLQLFDCTTRAGG